MPPFLVTFTVQVVHPHVKMMAPGILTSWLLQICMLRYGVGMGQDMVIILALETGGTIGRQVPLRPLWKEQGLPDSHDAGQHRWWTAQDDQYMTT